MMEPIKDNLDIDMDYVPTQEYVKQVERNNRTMKEQIRATYHRLSYKQLPKRALSMLVMESTKKLNFFLQKVGSVNISAPGQSCTKKTLIMTSIARYHSDHMFRFTTRINNKTLNTPEPSIVCT